ncbi:MAG: efflux RND transporter periplasmic adaptor subunit [Melioribacteraceae bacterium]|nr:efflux RND transporter periplasmic adaptor subunit [Melioribacteraceae bacterium]
MAEESKKSNYKVGDFVKKDAIVVEFPEDNPAVQYEQAKAAYENSKKNYERMKTLLEAGETSQANFDGAETKYLVDKRNYGMAKQALFIDAPYDGTIVEIMVNVGDGVDSKAPLFTIADLAKVKAKIWASEDEIKMIQKGMNAEINKNGKTYSGKVTETSISMDPKRRAYYAEVELDNPNVELKPGSSTEISIQIYENEKAIIVPRNLIQNNGNGNFVFVTDGNKAELRKLETGRENGLSVEVVDGLFPGDQLIVKGANMVTDGQIINEVQ